MIASQQPYGKRPFGGHSGAGLMVAMESPAAARRRLRSALRALRESVGMTQGDVSKRLDWSLSKVNRIEVGEVTVSRTDLEAMLRLFGIAGTETADRLMMHCQAARRRGWWNGSAYRPFITPALIDLIQYEMDAVRIRAYGPVLIPGPFQTRGYGNGILALYSTDLSEQQRTVRLDFRRELRAGALEREPPPQCVLLLDESAVTREVGGHQLMLDQLTDLVENVRAGRLDLRIVPLSAPAIFAMAKGFILLDLEGGLEGDDVVMYREDALSDEMLDSADIIKTHQDLFAQIEARALSSTASLRLVEARVATLLYEIGRG